MLIAQITRRIGFARDNINKYVRQTLKAGFRFTTNETTTKQFYHHAINSNFDSISYEYSGY
jgi:hypothetical protein